MQSQFYVFCRSWSIKYILLCTSSIGSITVTSVINVIDGHLPFRAWLPYDSNKPPMIWITSMQQITSLIFATLINVGTETLVFGFFLQTCAQLEIFESRLHNMIFKGSQYQEYFSSASSNKESRTISEYIRHHLSIYR